MGQQFKCRRCGRCFGLRRATLTHQQNCGSASLINCPAGDCRRKFGTLEASRQHFREFHLANMRVVRCRVRQCQVRFRSCEEEERHYLVRHRLEEIRSVRNDLQGMLRGMQQPAVIQDLPENPTPMQPTKFTRQTETIKPNGTRTTVTETWSFN